MLFEGLAKYKNRNETRRSTWKDHAATQPVAMLIAIINKMNKGKKDAARNGKLINALIILSILVVYFILRTMFDLEILGVLAATILAAMFIYRILQKKGII